LGCPQENLSLLNSFYFNPCKGLGATHGYHISLGTCELMQRLSAVTVSLSSRESRKIDNKPYGFLEEENGKRKESGGCLLEVV